MADNRQFYKLGKMVGLTDQEVKNTLSKRNKMIIYIIITIVITLTLLFIGNSIFHYLDPYNEGTLYGTIEPNFHRKIKKRMKKYRLI
jgi:hypothetical protein